MLHAFTSGMSRLIALAGVGPHHVISHGEVVGELIMLGVAFVICVIFAYGVRGQHA